MFGVGKNGKYVLQPNTSAKAEIWKHFSVVYEVLDNSELSEAKYFCACNRCLQVYQHKNASGQSFGTKNLIDHRKLCTGSDSQSQLQLRQCFVNKAQLSKADTSSLKRKEVEYCVMGYHSFRSVEEPALLNLMQTCVDFGAKYGKLDIKSAVSGRKVTDMRSRLAAEKVEAVELLRWGIRAGFSPSE